ncbi:hypothetical protein F441_06539 [Phytophthora nicotianae CJ01A1]|uniref:Uncharacterized protein n=4 Tax=Phytophthora nicotianae TaxID=4792 RepID=V9FE67_PHYNI|nr:hypothetical protein F443_06535 [Phytophthora nicotianae P1569]ETL43046.1 hypothetical protein L916_06348 [Phytophthora nicotianae]ETP19531.1 hypothetical protein F441_06539 [Phytophthora nicotianae CJ01A1]ETP47471.1 hypothetical protein F442_06578 [Phytophthora nicotianae P10297]
MGSAPSQKDAVSHATEVEVAAAAQEPQKSNQMPKDHHSDDNICVCDGVSPSKKRRRTQSGEAKRDPQENGAAVSEEQTQESEEKVEAPKENGHVENEKEAEKEQIDGDIVSNGIKEPDEQEKATTESVGEEVQVNGERAEEQEKQEGDTALTTEGVTSGSVPPSVPVSVSVPVPIPVSVPVLERVPSPAVHTGIDMVFPDDEVPIELCPFSSDGSAEEMMPDSPPRRFNKSLEVASKTTTATPTTPAPAPPTPGTPADTALTPASVTADDSVTPNSVNRTVGRRKRRKKLSFSAPRSKAATNARQEQNKTPASPALEDKISISMNGYAAQNGVEADSGENAPPSPVYPDTDASHLYPSTSEGEPWRWEDVDPYFDPLVQSDLENLIRWRKENADFIAANPSAWRGVSGMESKRAVIESMLADASDASTAHVDIPIRRGRSYRDVWEEKDFLDQQKRDNSVGENHVKSQVIKKRRATVNTDSSVLDSHRDLVYGYDDDLFQEFRGRLEERVKAYHTELSPATRLQDDTSDMSADEIVFEEEVLSIFPVQQLHPASLGLWKLRKNQVADFSVVHPASVNRTKVPSRSKEEMKRHHQRQYELQLQQTDELADPSDGDDESTSETARDQLRATISNSEVTDELPSFGNCVEEDEISQALAASMRKLISLSIYNWRTAQLVYERAACSIECAPILEGEAAAARELEEVFLQLCPPEEANADTTAPPGTGPTRKPINSAPHDMIAYSIRHDIADNCSWAVAASVEFALGLSVGDVVDVLDRNGCWNYGEVVEIYSENKLGISKFVLMRFSLWSEDTVEWIAASEGRILPQGVADGTRSYSVGPTRAHRARVRYDQNLARRLERSFPQRQANRATAASQMQAQRHHNAVLRSSSDQQKTPQKRKRKRPAKSTAVATTS